MIRVRMEPGKIEIDGHAGYGVMGEDIVCAGVSALGAGVLLAILENDAFSDVTKEIESGHMCICYREEQEKAEVCHGILSVFLKGVELIAEEYPENVEISGCCF